MTQTSVQDAVHQSPRVPPSTITQIPLPLPSQQSSSRVNSPVLRRSRAIDGLRHQASVDGERESSPSFEVVAVPSDQASKHEWSWPPVPSTLSQDLWETFARPMEWSYPVIQEVLFSSVHGIVNVTALWDDCKKARRNELKRRTRNCE